jgi:peptidoglycan hydrolase CwlO-like protein
MWHSANRLRAVDHQLGSISLSEVKEATDKNESDLSDLQDSVEELKSRVDELESRMERP